MGNGGSPSLITRELGAVAVCDASSWRPGKEGAGCRGVSTGLLGKGLFGKKGFLGLQEAPELQQYSTKP